MSPPQRRRRERGSPHRVLVDAGDAIVHNGLQPGAAVVAHEVYDLSVLFHGLLAQVSGAVLAQGRIRPAERQQRVEIEVADASLAGQLGAGRALAAQHAVGAIDVVGAIELHQAASQSGQHRRRKAPET
eukprot:scaffold1410_cov242-Pinguiococcus_pyrenoidosus.AAC.16